MLPGISLLVAASVSVHQISAFLEKSPARRISDNGIHQIGLLAKTALTPMRAWRCHISRIHNGAGSKTSRSLTENARISERLKKRIAAAGPNERKRTHGPYSRYFRSFWAASVLDPGASSIIAHSSEDRILLISS